jgi:hypothetical protein
VTCIVGLVDKDENVWIGGDSAGAGGYALHIRKDPKVFKNGPFVIGGTSSWRMLQLLRYAFVPPEYYAERDKDLDRFMTVNVVNAFRECFKAGGFATSEKGQEEGGRFLVGFAGRLYFVDSDYQIGQTVCGYAAVGCGDDIAHGVLYATPDMAPRERIEMALKAAEQHSAGVRGPWTIECLEGAKEPKKAKEEKSH